MKQAVSTMAMANYEDSLATAFYRRHAPVILASLRLNAPSPEDAEDLLLVVFEAAFAHGEILQRDENAQRAWLRQVARNKLADYYRGRQRHNLGLVPLEMIADDLYEDERYSPENAALLAEERKRVAATLARIPEPQQQVLRLRFVYGLRGAEIAAILGKRHATVRMLMSRALKLFRHLYEKE